MTDTSAYASAVTQVVRCTDFKPLQEGTPDIQVITLDICDPVKYGTVTLLDGENSVTLSGSGYTQDVVNPYPLPVAALLSISPQSYAGGVLRASLDHRQHDSDPALRSV